jgi:heterodisulfide reductase subunit A-like polyferredoxin
MTPSTPSFATVLAPADVTEELRIGVYVCHCGLNIAQTVDCDGVAAKIANLPDVAVSKGISYACSEPGQREIREDIEKNSLNRIVMAACSPRLHEPTFRQMVKDAGLNPYLMEMANLREQCSWVHMKHPAEATDKAYDLVTMALARARHLSALTEQQLPMTQRALVIGGGVAGIQASLDLADTGYDVIMVEKQPSIGGVMAQLDKTFPTMDCSI